MHSPDAAEPDRLLIPILSACNFVIGMGAFVVIGVLEPLGADLQRTPAQAGLLMTVYSITYAILSPLLVAATGRVGRRRVMAGAVVLFALSCVLSALATDFVTLTLFRVLAAAGAGMFTPVAAAVAASVYPAAQRARVLAAVFFGMTLAQVLGVPGGSWIAYTFGWRWAFWVVVALALPCIWLMWTRVPAGLRFQVVTLGDLGQVLRQGRMLLAVLFTASYLGTIYVVYTYMAPLLSETMGYGRNGVSAQLLIFGAGAVVGNVLGGFLTDRFGWRITLSVLCIGQVILLPFFSFLPMATTLLALLSFCWSVCGWSFMAAQQSRLITLSGPRAPVVLALNAAAIYIGAAIGSAIGGLVIALFGIKALGIAASLCAIWALAHLTHSARHAPAEASTT